jgi:hypothetical protein
MLLPDVPGDLKTRLGAALVAAGGLEVVWGTGSVGEVLFADDLTRGPAEIRGWRQRIHSTDALTARLGGPEALDRAVELAGRRGLTPLKGCQVAVLGEFASMSAKELRDALKAARAKPRTMPNKNTTVVILGSGGPSDAPKLPIATEGDVRLALGLDPELADVAAVLPSPASLGAVTDSGTTVVQGSGPLAGAAVAWRRAAPAVPRWLGERFGLGLCEVDSVAIGRLTAADGAPLVAASLVYRARYEDCHGLEISSEEHTLPTDGEVPVTWLLAAWGGASLVADADRRARLGAVAAAPQVELRPDGLTLSMTTEHAGHHLTETESWTVEGGRLTWVHTATRRDRFRPRVCTGVFWATSDIGAMVGSTTLLVGSFAASAGQLGTNGAAWRRLHPEDASAAVTRRGPRLAIAPQLRGDRAGVALVGRGSGSIAAPRLLWHARAAEVGGRGRPHVTLLWVLVGAEREALEGRGAGAGVHAPPVGGLGDGGAVEGVRRQRDGVRRRRTRGARRRSPS